MDIWKITECVKEELTIKGFVQIEVSARHVHLSAEDVDALFGRGYELKSKRALSQPGQYVCEERVTIVGPKGKIENIAILGPVRKNSQIEVSRTDCFTLGIHAPIRESGSIKGTPGATIVGLCGRVEALQGVIVAQRHIHMTPGEARIIGCKDKERVQVEVLSERPLIFKDVLIRVDETYRLRMHLDIDEANAGEIKGFTLGKIIK